MNGVVIHGDEGEGMSDEVPAILTALPDEVPPRVRAALSFVVQSAGLMTPVVGPGVSGLEVIERDPHAKHEAAFERACNCLGTYFATGKMEGVPARPGRLDVMDAVWPSVN